MKPDIRDAVIGYTTTMTGKTELSQQQILTMIGISKGKYFHWKNRMGKQNNHHSALPKRHWLLSWEKEAIRAYAKNHYAENDFFLRDGYRRVAYRMLDENIVAVSPSSVYRIVKAEGLLNQWKTIKTSAKGNGFEQPTKPHEHWHMDIKYINVCGSFLFLMSVMDGYSRFIVHHEVRTSMTEYDVQLTLERAKEKYPHERPRIISDNGGQFLAKDFQEFIKFLELTHIKTSVAYPQSNGKLERFHRSIGMECLSIHSFLSIDDARNIIAAYVEHYNRHRLHSALNYLTPEDMLLGRNHARLTERKEKLCVAALNRHHSWTILAT